MKFANNQTIEQLNALHIDGQFTELRAIYRDGRFPKQHFMNGDIEEGLSWADAKATEGADVYVGVNPRSKTVGKREHIDTVVALYTDLDLENQGVDEAIAELLNTQPAPNYINKSGRGIHAYWMIEPSKNKELWRKTNIALQKRFAHLKADKAVASDEARILRLVPYPNTKEDAGPVETVYVARGVYKLEELAKQLGSNVEPQVAKPYGTTTEIELTDEQLQQLATRLLRRAIEKGTPGNRNNTGLWLACQLRDNRIAFETARDIMEQFVDNTEHVEGGYNYREAEQTLRGVYNTPAREPLKIERSTPVTFGEARNISFSTHYTDAGNAENFATMFSDVLRYNHTAEKWMIWDGIHWAVDETGSVVQMAKETARAMLRAAANIEGEEQRKKAVGHALGSENLQKSKAMLAMAQSIPQLAVTQQVFDQHPFLAAAQNGTIDLKQCVLRDSERTEYITKQLGTVYDAGADCTRWKQFLAEVFDNNDEVISYVQRAIGYSLTGDTREQIVFLLHGNGRNGKSTFLETIALLMGEYADTASFASFDAGTKNEQTNDLAKLDGARFVTIIEADEDRRLNEAKIKSVTGQDRIQARFLHKEFFTFRPQFKIWLAMNHKPIISGTDDGIWRRIKLIPFNQNFRGREDKTLDAKLKAELPGILNWALEGLQQWLEHGLKEPHAVTAAVEQYRTDSDIVQQWFDECCEFDSKYDTPADTLYMAYKTWAEMRNDKVMTRMSWSRRMTDKGYETEVKKLGGKPVRVYTGIKADLAIFGKK